MNKIINLILLLLCVGCSSKYLILSAEVVSMTEQSMTEGYKMQEVGPIEDIFCPGPSKDQSSLGAIDELIKNTQQKSGSDFLSKVKIYFDSNDCLTLTAIGNKKAKI